MYKEYFLNEWKSTLSQRFILSNDTEAVAHNGA